MALTNFKKNEKQESGFDEMQRLMCSVPGCPNRWSVNMGKPMCSRHQWGKETSIYPHPNIEKSVTQTIKHWSDTENDGEVF